MVDDLGGNQYITHHEEGGGRGGVVSAMCLAIITVQSQGLESERSSTP